MHSHLCQEIRKHEEDLQRAKAKGTQSLLDSHIYNTLLAQAEKALQDATLYAQEETPTEQSLSALSDLNAQARTALVHVKAFSEAEDFAK